MRKKVLAFAIVTALLVGFAVGLYFRGKMFAVYCISKIYLQKLGSPLEGEYVGAVWRVVGDTMDTEFHTIRFNQTLVQMINASALPKGVSITGEIEVKIWQSNEYPPYWSVPFIKLNSEPITVIPKTYGALRYWEWFGGIKFKQIPEISIGPIQVDVYTLDCSEARLHVPFLVRVMKTSTGTPLLPDEYTADLGNYTYLIDISTTDVVKNQNYTKEILFTNPKDSKEWLKMQLKFTIGWDSATQKPFDDYNNIVTIQPVGGGTPIDVRNTFKEGETAYKNYILPLLIGWQKETYHPFAYYYYWMGDPSDREENIFKGNTIKWESLDSIRILAARYGPFSKWDDGTTAPLIRYYVWPSWHSDLLSEGLVVETTDKTNVYDYPGWYHPPPEVDHYWDKIYPFAPDLYYSYPNGTEPNGTRPAGLSLCDYLAAEIVNVPQKAEFDSSTGTYYSKFKEVRKLPYASRIPCLNPYDANCYAFGRPGVTEYIAHLPLGSRSWVFTMDISSELADAIIVTEKYLDVKIENFKGGNVEIQPKSSVTLTMDLVNTLDYDGHVQLVIKVDQPIPFDVSGTGLIYFKRNERKIGYTVTITNAYPETIHEKITGNFKLVVWNGERETSSVRFQLTFLPGAGLPNTGLSIRTVNKNNPSEGIYSVSITVVYGANKEKTKPGITGEGGYCSITLESPYEGYVDIYAVDNFGRFKSANMTVYVSPKDKNDFIIPMEPISEGEGFDLSEFLKQNLPYIVGGGMGAIGIGIAAYTLKRREEIRY